MIAQTNPRSMVTTYHRDAGGRVTRTVDPLARETLSAYDDARRLAQVTDALNRTTSYGYDDAGRLTAIGYSDATAPDVGFVYDDDGRRTAMSDGSGTSSYVYDSLGRLTAVTSGHGGTVRYGYDLADQQTSRCTRSAGDRHRRRTSTAGRPPRPARSTVGDPVMKHFELPVASHTDDDPARASVPPEPIGVPGDRFLILDVAVWLS